jgi:hypothetical protein
MRKPLLYAHYYAHVRSLLVDAWVAGELHCGQVEHGSGGKEERWVRPHCAMSHEVICLQFIIHECRRSCNAPVSGSLPVGVGVGFGEERGPCVLAPVRCCIKGLGVHWT